MQQQIKTAAVYISCFVFFLLALAGWWFKCSPAVCASRALVGAAVMYITVRIAGLLILGILIQAMADYQIRKNRGK